MDYLSIIKKRFKFLKKYGFIIKKYSNGVDVEIHYIHLDNVIEIYRTLCVGDLEYRYLNVDELLKTSHYAVDIIIQKHQARKHIFDWKDLFDDVELLTLNRNIEATNSDGEKISIFADFIERNVKKVIN